MIAWSAASATVFTVLTRIWPDGAAIYTPIIIATCGFLLLNSKAGPGISAKRILFTALFVRLILLAADPVIENDFYRYLWDGHMTLNGINPYSVPPASESLIAYETDFWTEITYKDFPTIYPPLGQLFFAISTFLFGGSVLGWRIVITAIEVVLLFFVFRATDGQQISKRAFLLYALNPLLLHETTVTAHIDILSVASIFVVIICMRAGHFKSAAPALACAVLPKYTAIILLPFFLMRRSRASMAKQTLSFTAILALGFMPFVNAGPLIFKGLAIFSQHWEFNGCIYYVTKGVATLFGYESGLARLICSGLFLLVYSGILILYHRGGISFEKCAVGAFTALLLFSPVANPWYFTWLMPFFLFNENRFLQTLCIFMPFSYLYFAFGDAAIWPSLIIGYGGPFVVCRFYDSGS